MARHHKSTFGKLLLGFSVGFGLLWILRKRSANAVLPSSWRRVLTEKYGVDQAGQILRATEHEYATLQSHYTLPSHPMLRFHLTKNIFPGLALYHILLEKRQGNKTSALEEIDALFRVWTLERAYPMLAPFRVLPTPFWLFRRIANGFMLQYPSAGWDFEAVENSDTCLAFNATRCFYLNTLTWLGAPELTVSFCKTDDVMAELFPASVQFKRTQTLGRGDSHCDFQYCKAERSAQLSAYLPQKSANEQQRLSS
ncbi:MAG TPA: L-2-amino-thiazoline-4-carboxylic acid hydrolase [Anaerolineaceae bacterium]|nr:L-2-amino-thiazoline-4-carboxylic acid hydrolase [Anaerolineaceae bacterium]